MLDPLDKHTFDTMVTKLRSDDPAFVTRIDRLGHPRRRLRKTLAILLWMAAPLCIFYGGWTGLILAAVAACYGARLMTKRSLDGISQAATSTDRR